MSNEVSAAEHRNENHIVTKRRVKLALRAQTVCAAAIAIAVAMASSNAIAACPFDVDASGQARASTDGLLLTRYALGLRGDALVANIASANLASSISDVITRDRLTLDIDGNGTFDIEDAQIITRHLAGYRSAALTNALPTLAGRPRADGDVAQAYIDLGCTPSISFAARGAPNSTPLNGLSTVLDASHRVSIHALDALLETNTPSATLPPVIAGIKVLGRRDSAILYLPNIAGAGDYRVYVEGRPVVVCAGYRQRASFPRETASNPSGQVVRELLQAVELPGLATPGSYRVVVEALREPCPFTGMPGHTSASIPMLQTRLATLTGGSVPIKSFNDAIAQYGVEIINGQGAASNWFLQSGQLRGQAVAPAAPNVIARSTIRVNLPFADEAVNAPIIDVGSNAKFDDFSIDGVGSFSRIANRSFGTSDAIEGAFGDWYFWGVSAQATVGQSSVQPPLGVQVWQRHGRLNVTLADWAQDVFAAVHFSSRTTKPVVVESQKYAHSFFRVDSGATGRRYWHWMMCGADSITKLVDPSTNIPRIRHLLRPGFYEADGVNPSEAAGDSADPHTANHRTECLNLLQLATNNPDVPQLANGSAGPGPNHSLIASINPQGAARGSINLTPQVFDRGYGTNSWNWRLDANNDFAGPLLEPFDQQAPLTHFDVFVRKDRMVLFINGRQAACWDLTTRPLAMDYGLIVYGQVLYHSDAEYDEYHVPGRTASNPYQSPRGLFHYSMNTVAADTRAWDAVGHAEKIDIPPLFNFQSNLCKRPGNIAVQ
jgi:hypothetical protein